MTVRGRDWFGAALLFFFLAYLAAACFVLGPFTDINAPKWFVIRAGGPLLLVAAWLRAAATGRRFVPRDALTVIVVLFLGVHVASLAVATNLGYGLERISAMVGLIATYLVAAHVCDERRGRMATLWMLLVIGAATSAYGIAQRFGYDFFAWREASEVPVDRGVSFFGHATFTASVLIQIIPIGVAFAIRCAWPARIVAGAITAGMLFHLSFTGARMATIAFLVSMLAAGVAWLALRPRREPRSSRYLARTGVAIVALFLVVAAAGSWFLARAWQEKDSDLFAIRQSSLALRLFNWETASRMIYAHPVLGVGAGNYEIVSPRYWNEVERMRFARNGRWMQQAHNDYLQTAAELGLSGVALLLALFAYAVVMALGVAGRRWGSGDSWVGLALFAAITAIALDANTTFSLQVPGSALVLFVLLGLASAMHAEEAPLSEEISDRG